MFGKCGSMNKINLGYFNIWDQIAAHFHGIMTFMSKLNAFQSLGTFKYRDVWRAVCLCNTESNLWQIVPSSMGNGDVGTS